MENNNFSLLGPLFYYYRKDNSIVKASFFDEVINQIPENEREIDPVAVLSMLSFSWICGDRTLIKGLKRSPWYGEIDDNNEIHLCNIPSHSNKRMEAESIATTLILLLQEEILSSIAGKKKVWLLLSGGMDSRVVAGVLHYLQEKGALNGIEINAATWGINGSRDIEYAKRISAMYNWQWHHIPLNSEILAKNFENSVRFIGAEVSPIHLHNFSWFEGVLSQNDIVLAASYGDSVGRGEFSSQNLFQLPRMIPKDRFNLLMQHDKRWAASLYDDIRSVRCYREPRTEMAWREVEHEAHYMRRKLAAVSLIINRWGKVKQVFTSPEVFGFMWSISPEIRDDEIYVQLLKKVDMDLLSIPWSRTGKSLLDNAAQSDSYEKEFFDYHECLLKSHSSTIENLILRGNIRKLDLFDMDQLSWMVAAWKKEKGYAYSYLREILPWLASLSIMCEEFNIKKSSDIEYTSNYHLLRRIVHKKLSRLKEEFVILSTSSSRIVNLKRSYRKLKGSISRALSTRPRE